MSGNTNTYSVKDGVTYCESVTPSGTIMFMKAVNNKLILHREDGPAVVYPTVFPDLENDKLWFLEGQMHREDGPAVIRGNTKKYYLYGNLCRFDGPAIIVERITEDREIWAINAKEINPDLYKQWLHDNGMNIDSLTKDDKMMITVVWGSREI